MDDYKVVCPQCVGGGMNWVPKCSRCGGQGYLIKMNRHLVEAHGWKKSTLDATGESMHQFASGARRSELKPRYDLIPTCGLKRIAQRYTLGAEKYGDYNWQKGLPLSDTINHIIDHLITYRDRINERKAAYLDPEEIQREIKAMSGLPDDDLAGAAWGCIALMWLEENGKLL